MIYYVDASNGNDLNGGLDTNNAWKNISKINNNNSIFKPGDSILFKRGEVWRETLTVPSNNIILGAYGSGAAPVISGAGVISSWIRNNGNVWAATVNIKPYIIIVDGLVLGEMQSSAGAVDSSGDWFWVSNILYLYSATDPNNRTIEGGARTYAINCNSKDYLMMDGLCLYGANSDAISAISTDHSTFKNLTVKNNFGKMGNFNGGNNTIDSCIIEYNGSYGLLWAGGNNIIRYNTIRYNGWRTNDKYVSGLNGQDNGTSIYENIIHDNAAGGGDAYAQGLYVDAGATNTDVYNNVVYNHTNGIGIYHKGSGNIYNNFCYDNRYAGIQIALQTANINISVYNNICTKNSEGFMQKLKNASYTINLTLYNNTFYHNIGREIYITDKLTSLVMKNNLLVPAGTNYAMRIASQLSLTSDFNCLYGTSNIVWYNSKTYMFADWNRLGFDTHSINADPQLTDPDHEDFHLKPGSPSLNAGINVGLTKDFYGNQVPVGSAPDIGAIEYQGISAAPAITSFAPASGPVGTVVTITGTNFTGATAVSFGGTAATSFTVVSATQITATVPAGAATGKVRVTTPAGYGDSSGNFTVVPAPAITSFAPASGPVGTVVTITGTNFTGATAVSFGGTAATSFTVVSATQITATVPAGAATGKVRVTTPAGYGDSSGNFTCCPGPRHYELCAGEWSGRHGGHDHRHGFYRRHGSELRRHGGNQLHRRVCHPDHRHRSGWCRHR